MDCQHCGPLSVYNTNIDNIPPPPSLDIDTEALEEKLCAIADCLKEIKERDDPQIEAELIIGCSTDPDSEDRFLVQGIYDEIEAAWTYTLTDGTEVEEGIDFTVCDRLLPIKHELFKVADAASGPIPGSMAAHGYILCNNGVDPHACLWLSDSPLAAGDDCGNSRITPIPVACGACVAVDEVFPEPEGVIFPNGINYGVSSNCETFTPVDPGTFSLTVSYS